MILTLFFSAKWMFSQYCRNKGEKAHKCCHCDKTFAQNGNLRNYMKVHTDERPN